MLRVLYVSGGGPGGITSHVRCLTQCLKGVADVAVCILGNSDVLRPQLDADGTKYYLCPCSSGHDWRIIPGLRRAIRDFQPDVLHFQGISLVAALYARFFTRIPRVCSIHTPSGRHPAWDRHILNLAVMPCYWLPVSTPNWNGFKSAYPKAKGEVFFNPIRVGEMKAKGKVVGEQRNGKEFVVGMVGRAADQKDWPSFHKVESIIQARLTQTKTNHPLSTSTSYLNLSFLNAGEKELCNGREAIEKMDLFAMTSKHEELPTVVLECFALGTPICGFIPAGGMSDIIGFSRGPLREVFIAERNCDKLADIVMDLMEHPEKRRALVEDGRQILENHFDAEKNCRGQLMDIYRKVIDEWR